MKNKKSRFFRWDNREAKEMKRTQKALARTGLAGHFILRPRLCILTKNQILQWVNIIVIALLTVSCKKDTPPVLKFNQFRMDIEITDNNPSGDAGGIFAFGNKDFPEGIDTNTESDQFLYLTDTPIYLERTLFFTASDTDQIYFWAYTSGSLGNQYSVEVFKNEISVFKSVGEKLSYEKIKL